MCICSGAIPKVIFPDNPHILWIRDTESVENFQKRLSNARRMVIVGNGGIATEMVYEITGKKNNIFLVHCFKYHICMHQWDSILKFLVQIFQE